MGVVESMGRIGKQAWRSGVVAVALCLLASACSVSSGSKGYPKPAASQATVLVTTGTAAVGGKPEIVLVDAAGKTLYYHTTDRVGHVTCTDATECADNWPPLKLPSNNARIVGGTRVAGTFGTVPSPSGGQQVTFNGWPLYRFVNDAKEGDAAGQGWNGQWFVATPTVGSPS